MLEFGSNINHAEQKFKRHKNFYIPDLILITFNTLNQANLCKKIIQKYSVKSCNNL